MGGTGEPGQFMQPPKPKKMGLKEKAALKSKEQKAERKKKLTQAMTSNRMSSFLEDSNSDLGGSSKGRRKQQNDEVIEQTYQAFITAPIQQYDPVQEYGLEKKRAVEPPPQMPVIKQESMGSPKATFKEVNPYEIIEQRKKTEESKYASA